MPASTAAPAVSSKGTSHAGCAPHLATAIRLFVLSGFHGGARCDLPGGESSVGSGTSDTVVLSDAGILPGHVTLGMQDASVILCAAHDGVALDGAALASGTPVAAVPPFDLALAGVALHCEAGPGAVRNALPAASRVLLAVARFPVLRSPWGLSALVCAAVAVLIIPPAMSSIASGTKPGQPVADPVPFERPATPPSVAKPSVAPGSGSSALADATRALQAELAAGALAGVQVSVADGAILARGQLEPQSEAGWRLVQQQFDSRYGRGATLIDEVRFTATPAPKIAVDAVWTGPNPNVVIKGQKFFEGATLPNGFLVERIAPGELLVMRDGRRQALRV